MRNMGLYSNTLIFFFLNFSIIYGEYLCPVSSCGNSTLNIHHPFKLQNQIITNNCTYLSLVCSLTQRKIIVNLLYSGQFYVQNIDYIGRVIQLYDPADCLMRRLMNFSFDSSPFKANFHENYTFYVCPLDSLVFEYHVNRIGCLSNSTNFTVAMREPSREFMEVYGCRDIGSWLLPVSGSMQYDDGGFYDDNFLFLTWDDNVCKDCGDSDDQKSGKWKPKPITKILAIALSMPALIILGLSCCSVFCFHILKMIADKQDAYPIAAPTTVAPPQTTVDTPMPPPSTTTNTGLNESKIIARTEIVVLSENDERIPSGNSNTCSICLENYCKRETIRIISKCGHCFHDSCIQQWLGKNSTCPVCRTSVSGVAIM